VPIIAPNELAKLRLWAQRVTRECEERLSREEVLVLKLNKQRTEMSRVGFLTKGEAAKITGVFPHELLELESCYFGAFVRADYLFISKSKLEEKYNEYKSDVTLAELIDDVLRACP
jgi:hypothetical protein